MTIRQRKKNIKKKIFLHFLNELGYFVSLLLRTSRRRIKRKIVIKCINDLLKLEIKTILKIKEIYSLEMIMWKLRLFSKRDQFL